MMSSQSKRSLSERTGYFADHAFLGGTYQMEQLKYIRELRKKEGFYDSKTRQFSRHGCFNDIYGVKSEY